MRKSDKEYFDHMLKYFQSWRDDGNDGIPFWRLIAHDCSVNDDRARQMAAHFFRLYLQDFLEKTEGRRKKLCCNP